MSAGTTGIGVEEEDHSRPRPTRPRHTFGPLSPNCPVPDPRSPAGNSQGVGCPEIPHHPQALLPALPGGGRGFAFTAQQPPPAFPGPAALGGCSPLRRDVAKWGPGQGWAAAVPGLLLQSVAFKPLLPPAFGSLPKAFKRGASLSPHPTFQNRSRVVQSKGRQRPPEALDQALLCAQAVSSSLSVSLCACRVDTHVDTAQTLGGTRAQGDTGVSAGSYMSASSYGHGGPEARAFATVCACRAGVRHVSLSLGAPMCL